MKKQLTKTILYTHPKTGKKFLIWITIFGLLLTGCGASIGTASFGTTSYMVEHNRKMEIMHDSYTPSDRRQQQVVRTWEK